MIKIKERNFWKNISISLATLQTISVIVLVVIMSTPPIVENHIIYEELPFNTTGYDITASWFEPSFVATWFNDTCIMGGMWAIINGSKTIDIRNFEPDVNGSYSIINVYRNHIITVNKWSWGHRYATWYTAEDGVYVEIEWIFYENIYFEEFVDPYFEYAAASLYNENATITIWDGVGTYDFTYEVVPRKLLTGNIELIHLNYIPETMFPNAKAIEISYSNETCSLWIDDAYGTDFYRSFGAGLWEKGRYIFEYSLRILW